MMHSCRNIFKRPFLQLNYLRNVTRSPDWVLVFHSELILHPCGFEVNFSLHAVPCQFIITHMLFGQAIAQDKHLILPLIIYGRLSFPIIIARTSCCFLAVSAVKEKKRQKKVDKVAWKPQFWLLSALNKYTTLPDAFLYMSVNVVSLPESRIFSVSNQICIF